MGGGGKEEENRMKKFWLGGWIACTACNVVVTVFILSQNNFAWFHVNKFCLYDYQCLTTSRERPTCEI